MEIHICGKWDLVAEFPDGFILLIGDQKDRGSLSRLIHALIAEQKQRIAEGGKPNCILRDAKTGEHAFDPRKSKKYQMTG